MAQRLLGFYWDRGTFLHGTRQRSYSAFRIQYRTQGPPRQGLQNPLRVLLGGKQQGCHYLYLEFLCLPRLRRDCGVPL